MQIHAIPFIVLLTLAPFAGTARADDSAGEPTDIKARKIVEDADRIRFPGEGFQVDISIVTSGKDRDADEHKYRVLSKGNENTVVMITEPAREEVTGYNSRFAPVAQLDRVLVSEAKGHRFESCRARQISAVCTGNIGDRLHL